MNKLDLDLTTLDSNAFSLLGAFSKAAKKAGWTKEEISEVYTKATSGDYDHLVFTLMEHCE